MTKIWQGIENAAWNLVHRMGLVDILDIIIVAVLVYELMLLTRKTRGGAVIKGVALLLVVAAISRMVGLISMNWLLTALLTNGVIALMIIFQPELRRAMEQIGRGTFAFHSLRHLNEEEQKRIIDEIVLTMHDLSQRKVGALMVFEKDTGLQELIDTGTQLNARISAPLLENIFEPKTPLHDGAVVIRGDTVMAAACIVMNLTENSGVARELGTRHRAAIGVTETTDAMVLVVSEETGTMSMAAGGQIYRPLSDKQVRRELRKLYSAPKKKSILDWMLKHVKEDENEKEE